MIPSASATDLAPFAVLFATMATILFFHFKYSAASDVDESVDKPKTMKTLATKFPKALKNADLVSKAHRVLSKYGFGDSTLVATSFCCDELCRPLEKELASAFKDQFNMGGLAGFSFSGLTGFGAMSHHIPDGGSCLVVYGPHVGVDSNGMVGTVDRRGRESGGACCGSAVAAHSYVTKVYKGEKVGPITDVVDAQQQLVQQLILPHMEQLVNAQDPDVELPHVIYDAQTTLMEDIIAKGCQHVAGEGKIALLGGIMINTPVGVSDYFLPLNFKLYNNSGKVLEDLFI